jgi:hypothetical protein
LKPSILSASSCWSKAIAFRFLFSAFFFNGISSEVFNGRRSANDLWSGQWSGQVDFHLRIATVFVLDTFSVKALFLLIILVQLRWMVTDDCFDKHLEIEKFSVGSTCFSYWALLKPAIIRRQSPKVFLFE